MSVEQDEAVIRLNMAAAAEQDRQRPPQRPSAEDELAFIGYAVQFFNRVDAETADRVFRYLESRYGLWSNRHRPLTR